MAGSVGSYGRLDNLDFETNSDHFRAQGAILVDEGVDLLILVTLGSTARTIKAMVNATRDLGVPVWVSISCVRDRDTGAVMFGIEESSEATYVAETYGPLPEAVREIMTVGGSAFLVMHSVRDVTEDAVKVMRTTWSGPVGAYSNAGCHRNLPGDRVPPMFRNLPSLPIPLISALILAFLFAVPVLDGSPPHSTRRPDVRSRELHARLSPARASSRIHSRKAATLGWSADFSG